MRRPGLVAAVAALVGIGTAAGVLQARERQFPLPAVTTRMLYLQSGPTAQRLALSFDAIASDVYWIRTIQHYGRDYKNRSRAGRFELLQPLLDITTSLDPNFLVAYRFGAIFLAVEPPEGPGRSDQAIALLEKGLRANPTRWQLAHDIGFTHYFYTGDFQQAAEWFRRAAAMPGAPSWIGPLAATTLAQGGNRAGARQLLGELRGAQEEYVRRAAERALMQLDALDAIDELGRRIAMFTAQRGRPPAGWPELITAGLIPGVPVDQFGKPFVYEAATRAVTLAPDSPLLPLPPTLQPR